MISLIAWRNIWRNKLRSMVLVVSIMLGIWSGVFVLGLSFGLNNQRTQSALNTNISHAQIHHPEFLEEQSIRYDINNYAQIAEVLNTQEELKSFSGRTILNGMASSASAASGVKVTGMEPSKEMQVTDLYTKLTEGAYFEERRRNPIVIGEKLAEKLKLKIRSKLVLTFQDENNEMVSAAFRVAGIFKTSATRYDESNVFVKQKDLAKLLGVSKAPVHEIAMMNHQIDEIDTVVTAVQTAFPDLKVRSWKEVSPELGYADEMMTQSLYVFIGIIMMALAFGMINIMLMAVLERRKELGMLMAVGMNKMKVFLMIVFETLYLSMLGGPIGLILGWLTIKYFSKAGIDLSAVGKGLESMGVGSIVYPELETVFYWNVGLMVVVTALLASVYPARKALKLKPAETIRAI